MSSETGRGERFKDVISREEIRLAVQHTPTMQATSAVVAFVLSYVVRDIIPPANALAWGLMVLLTVAGRLGLYFGFRKVEEGALGWERWRNLFLIISFISGIVWGASAFMMFPSHDPALASLFVLVIASLSAATTASHSSLRWAPAAWAVPAMLLYTGRCILEGGPFGLTAGFLLIFCLFTVIRFSFYQNNSIASAIAIRFANLELLAELQKANNALRQEITQRKLAENMVRHSEADLQVILEATADGVLAVDDKGKIIKANRRFADLWKIPQPVMEVGEVVEVLKPVLDQLVDPDSFLKKVRSLHETAGLDTDLLFFKDGRVFESFSAPLMREGSVIGRVWSFRDITEGKRAEAALWQSQERFRELAELLPETIFELDVTGNLTFVNRNAYDYFGYSKEEFERGINGFTMVSPEDRPRAMENAKRVMGGEKIGLNEYNALRKDGSTFPVIMHSAAKYHDGKPSGIRGIVIDITEKKKLESQLLQAHKMEAIGTLAGGIAHDFNNLLQVVHGYAELLLREKGQGAEHNKLQEICRAANRGRQLTRQLLTFSRKVESELQPIDLNRTVDDVRTLLERTIHKMIRIELRTMADLSCVNADASQIEQILMNLAVNARDAMPDGGMLLFETRNVIVDEDDYHTHAVVPPGKYVLLEVTDTGHGMDQATLEHIFEPFFTTKEIGKGTGLGLAIVYGIVRNHHGYIACTSTPGEGTTFRIHFPAVERLEQTPAGHARRMAPSSGKETILLVDDEGPVRSVA
jgi:PAS domain S-box-containing protein